MHLRIRSADFLDKHLQQLHHPRRQRESDSQELGWRSSSSVSSSTTAEQMVCWQERSVATPQQNYAVLAKRSLLPACDITNASIGRPSSSCSSVVGQGRPILIRLAAGTGGLADGCSHVQSNFGCGTVGLGVPGTAKQQDDILQARLEAWNSRKEKWEFEQRAKEQAKRKQLTELSRHRTLQEMRMMKQIEEEKRSMVVQDTKKESSELIKQALEEREHLRDIELAGVHEMRTLERESLQRRAAEAEAHSRALQHVARLEFASRKLDLAHRLEQEEIQTEILRASTASERFRHNQLLKQKTIDRLDENRRGASAIRSKIKKWEHQQAKREKEDTADKKSDVKKLYHAIKEGAANARAHSEYQKSRRHDALKKETDALLQQKAERDAERLEAAQKFAADLRSAANARSPSREKVPRSSRHYAFADLSDSD